jgi:pSer/pThr/pTyr-binding forkhead associated (FHA) protein
VNQKVEWTGFMANIKIFFRDSQIDEVSLKMGSTTVGRNDNNDIQIDNLSVSGQHARIVYQNGQYFLQDLGSTNNTYINGNMLVGNHSLQEGDIIAIAKYTLKFYEFGDDELNTSSQHVEAEQHISDPGATMMANKVQLNDLLSEHKIEDASKKGQVIAWLNWQNKKQVSGTLPLSRGRIIIGKGVGADLQTGGWFAPRISAIVSFEEEGYMLSNVKNARIKLNGEVIKGIRRLKPGDLIEVRAISCTFFVKAITEQ